LAEGARGAESVLPARAALVDRLREHPGVLRRRRPVDALALDLVPHADAERIDAGEHVELGEREGVEAGERYRMPYHHGVEPAAAPRPARRRAVLVAVGTQAIAERVAKLGREGPAADPRGVRLRDADDAADHARREPGAGGRTAGHTARRGDERIDPVVDVEQRTLRPLEEYARAARDRGAHLDAGVGDEWRQLLAVAAVLREDLLHGERRLAEQGLEVPVLLPQVARQGLGEPRLVEEIAHANSRARHLVLVGGTDATSRGADGARLAQPLAGVVDRAVIRHDEVRLVAHAQ